MGLMPVTSGMLYRTACVWPLDLEAKYLADEELAGPDDGSAQRCFSNLIPVRLRRRGPGRRTGPPTEAEGPVELLSRWPS